MDIKIPNCESVKRIFDIIHMAGYDVRIVGGYVRDAVIQVVHTPCNDRQDSDSQQTDTQSLNLQQTDSQQTDTQSMNLQQTDSQQTDTQSMNLQQTDIDFATTAVPDVIIDIFTTAGYTVIPTGYDHGTVTVVMGGHSFEITTLRSDVTTDGRRAVVQYTTDWQQDSGRRDFTINALYADNNGMIYDYHSGLADIKNKTLRCVGTASNRMREDALRIMRYYRFTVQLGWAMDDTETLQACENTVDLLLTLSAERIANEYRKILSSPNSPADVISHMAHSKALENSVRFPVVTDLSLLSGATAQQKDFILKMVAILGADVAQVQNCARLLKLSKAEKNAMVQCARIYADKKFTIHTMFQYVYYFGKDAVTRACYLRQNTDVKNARAIHSVTVKNRADVNNTADVKNYTDKPAVRTDYISHIKRIADWEIPVLPITGKDLLAIGVPQGVKMGAVLKTVQSWWVQNDFRPKKQDCLLFVLQKIKP